MPTLRSSDTGYEALHIALCEGVPSREPRPSVRKVYTDALIEPWMRPALQIGHPDLMPGGSRYREMNRREWTEEETAILIEVWNAGASRAEASAATGFSNDDVTRKLAELRAKGVKVRMGQRGTRSVPGSQRSERRKVLRQNCGHEVD